ncbi:MAG: branched-chain amino acid ABC transporter permease [Armatimonadetes bacterium]|nr:branched-chain amino acid ABC transporter permease [Armatimonadota bacterium]
MAAFLAYPWIWFAPYYHALGFYVLLDATMATSWNIMGGYTGYKSLGHSTFFGLGAYLVAISAKHWGWDPLWSAPLLALVVMAAAFVLGWIMLRTTGSAFVIATIAMLLIFRLLALNLGSITEGAPGISQPLAPWSPAYSRLPFYYYMGVCLVAALAASAAIRRSRFGLGLLAIRDDEGKAEMVGVHTTLYKVVAFGVSAYFVALGGGIWSYFQTHISPVFAFDLRTSVDMILMTMLGGLGTLWGPLLGAVILVPARDFILFRFGATQIHLALSGALMLAIIIFLPRGILPSLGDRLARRRASTSAYLGARLMTETTEHQ